MSRRTLALTALMPLVFAASVLPTAASADAGLSDPATLILRGGAPIQSGPVRHYQFIALEPKACFLRDEVFTDKGPTITQYTCRLLPGEAPLVRGKPGTFSLIFDFPQGSRQVDFGVDTIGVSPVPTDLPPQIFSGGGRYEFLGPMPAPSDAKSTDNPRSQGAAPATQVLHVAMDGFDCKFEIVGQGFTPCLIFGWANLQYVEMLVSGTYTRQLDPIAQITLRSMGKSWQVIPEQFDPYTPLMIAAHSGDMQAVQTLLANHADMGSNPAHDSPLLLAINAGHLDVAKLLVEHGAPPGGLNRFGMPVLSIAIEQDQHDKAGAIELVKSMIAHGADANQSGTVAPLFAAVEQKDLALVTLLLSKGADVNGKMNRVGQNITPYDDAMLAGATDIMGLLAQHGGKQTIPSVAQSNSWNAYQAGLPSGTAPARGTPIVPAKPLDIPVPDTAVLMWSNETPGGSGVEVQYFIMGKDSCRFRGTRLAGTDVQSVEYRCHVLPGGQPIARGQNGTFMVSLDLPEGIRSVRFTMSGNNFVAAQSLNPETGTLVLMRSFRFMNGVPPELQAVTADQPAAKLTVKDGDCTLQLAGRGSAHCALTNWTDRTADVLVSGDFLQQPTPQVRINAAQQGDHWSLFPAHFISFTPLMLAARSGDSKAVADLITRGTDLDAHDPYEDAPVEIALLNNHPDIVKMLVEHGAKLNAPTKAGGTVLISAIGTAGGMNDGGAQALEYTKLLVAHGADVNQTGKETGTPLMIAVMSDQAPIVGLLLDKGADVDAQVDVFGRRGVTAYEMAGLLEQQLEGHPQQSGGKDMKDVMTLLKQHGASAALPNHGLPQGSLLGFRAGGAPGSVMLVGQPGALTEGGTVTVTDVNSGQAASGAVGKDGSFSVSLVGALPDLFSIQSSSGKRKSPIAYMHGNDPVLKLTIGSPLASGLMTGTYVAPPNTGITANGEPVPTSGGKFVLYAGGLPQGVNHIDVTLTTQGGMRLVQTVTVPAAGVTRNSPAPDISPATPDAEKDAAIQALWRDYCTAMVAGDKDAAMQLMDGNAQDKLGPVFDVLKQKLKGIVSSFSPLMKSSLSGDTAEYVIVRKDVKDGGNMFFVEFVQDQDGIWLLDSM